MVDHGDAKDSWQFPEGWGEHIAKGVGSALTATNEDAWVPLLQEVDDLVAGGHLEMAILIGQSALYRAVTGRVTRGEFEASTLTDSSVLDDLLRKALSTEIRSTLLARAVGAIARVDVERRVFDRAQSLFLLAASIWEEAGDVDQRAVNLLRAGAAAFQLDEPAEALEYSTLALDLFVRLNDDQGALLATLNLIHMASGAGEMDRAEELLEQARKLSRGRRDAHISSSIKLEEAILRGQGGDHPAARKIFRAVHRSALRRGDFSQALSAARNLAVVASEESAPAREVHWYQVAIVHAQALGDWEQQQELERSLAIALVRSERYPDAVDAFDRAIALNDEFGSSNDAAQARADKGAVLLQHAIQESLSDTDFDDLTSAAVRTLELARQELEHAQDFEWAAIAVRNLRTAWILRKEEADGAAVLIDAAASLAADSEYLLEVRRNAAWLLLAAGSGSADDRPVQWIVEAASTSDPIETAWALAKQAANLASHGFSAEALSLYDVALARISPEQDPSAYGNMLNDSVVVMNESDDFDTVRGRLLQVEQIARDTHDRVLLSLALANLAETAIRMSDGERARAYLLECVDLAKQLGDAARAASALSTLANTYLSDGEEAEAIRHSDEALELAIRSGSDEAWAHATSAVASAQFLRGDYEAAFQGWMACIEQEDVGESGEHQAFALDALAATGDWSRFRKQLERFAEQSQKTHTQFEFVEKLHLSALTWLRLKKPQAAGKVIAYGVVLAVEAASIDHGVKGRVLSTADRQNSLLKVSTALGAAQAVFELLELPEKKVRTIRNAYERTIRRIAGENAGELLQVVETFMHIGEDADNRSNSIPPTI